jgi:UDP-GlcNAc3NAcA epimerase
MIKVLTIVGARPQFVKAAALSRAFSELDAINEIIVHTGQHFDKTMSSVFFDEMNIPQPKYNLNINSLGHGAMTGRMLEGIETLILKEKPEVLLVYGDTNSTIAGALAARKLHVKVAHVEAGLRSFNMEMPEEINRILTDRISDVLFCPTDTAVNNLKAEGFEQFPAKIVRSGDVMQDAALYYAKQSEEKSTVKHITEKEGYVLATIHRAENTDNLVNLKSIVDALNAIHEEVKVVLPIHPRTRKIIADSGLRLKVNTIDPVGYFDMVELLKYCTLVMTDSGGVQKEAFFFKKPCITLREQTEWTELVEHGFNEVVGTDQSRIYSAFNNALQKDLDYSVDLYGRGNASINIANALVEYMS